jgi:hypothetical protein
MVCWHAVAELELEAKIHNTNGPSDPGKAAQGAQNHLPFGRSGLPRLDSEQREPQ